MDNHQDLPLSVHSPSTLDSMITPVIGLLSICLFLDQSNSLIFAKKVKETDGKHQRQRGWPRSSIPGRKGDGEQEERHLHISGMEVLREKCQTQGNAARSDCEAVAQKTRIVDPRLELGRVILIWMGTDPP